MLVRLIGSAGRRVASFSETVGAVMRWMTGRRRPAQPRERQIEAKIVERLAAEIEEECACLQVVDNAFPQWGTSPRSPSRGRHE